MPPRKKLPPPAPVEQSPEASEHESEEVSDVEPVPVKSRGGDIHAARAKALEKLRERAAEKQKAIELRKLKEANERELFEIERLKATKDSEDLKAIRAKLLEKPKAKPKPKKKVVVQSSSSSESDSEPEQKSRTRRRAPRQAAPQAIDKDTLYRAEYESRIQKLKNEYFRDAFL